MPPGDRQRLEDLEAWVAALCESAAPLLVEGTNDREALRAIGITNRIEVINRGVPLVDLAESLGVDGTTWVILTDRDRKGGGLARQLEVLLRASGAAADHRWRRDLFRTARVREIEELLPYLRGLQDRVRPVGRRVREHFVQG